MAFSHSFNNEHVSSWERQSSPAFYPLQRLQRSSLGPRVFPCKEIKSPHILCWAHLFGSFFSCSGLGVFFVLLKCHMALNQPCCSMQNPPPAAQKGCMQTTSASVTEWATCWQWGTHMHSLLKLVLLVFVRIKCCPCFSWQPGTCKPQSGVLSWDAASGGRCYTVCCPPNNGIPPPKWEQVLRAWHTYYTKTNFRKLRDRWAKVTKESTNERLK